MQRRFLLTTRQINCLGAALSESKLYVHEQIMTDVSEKNDEEPEKFNSKMIIKNKYDRHIPLPRTEREFAVFKRDHHYAHYRPSIDLPWCQHKKRTYMDDAERLYGRKETWHNLPNLEVKEKLFTLLKNYLRDITAAARAEVRSAEKYENLCSEAANDYRKHITLGAFYDARLLRGWAEKMLQITSTRNLPSTSTEEIINSELSLNEFEPSTNKRANVISDKSSNRNNDSTLCDNNDDYDDDATPKNADTELMEKIKSATENVDKDDRVKCVRNVNTEANFNNVKKRKPSTLSNNFLSSNLVNTPALRDLQGAEDEVSGVEAFPFLRKRAVEFGETLDPSLLNWTAQHYPEDTQKTFREPPQLRESLKSASSQKDSSSSTSEEIQQVSWQHRDNRAEVNAVDAPEEKTAGRHMNVFRRLRHSLKMHDDHYKATFDGEGVFYPLRLVHDKHNADEIDSNNDDDVKWCVPASLRGSALTQQTIKELHSSTNHSSNAGKSKVVKVPWDVAAKAHQQGYSSEILRARERLIRLTRGENPESIP